MEEKERKKENDLPFIEESDGRKNKKSKEIPIEAED